MARATVGGASRCLPLAGAGFCLLATLALSGMPQTSSPVHPSSPSHHPRTRKPTWHNGPASIIPETEVVPPRGSSVPPPVRAVALGAQGEGNGALEGKSLPAGAANLNPGSTPRDERSSHSAYVDPEERTRGELNCLRAHTDARQAFYADLSRTVDRVRAGQTDEGTEEKKSVPCPP